MAKKFHFRLQTVLRLRKQIEDQKKRDLAARVDQMASLERRESALNDQIGAEVEHLRSTAARPNPDVARLSSQRYWVSRLRTSLLETRREIAQQQQHIGEARQTLVQASREVRVLEKLRQKKRDAYLDNLQREETLENDERAAQNFIHAHKFHGKSGAWQAAS